MMRMTIMIMRRRNLIPRINERSERQEERGESLPGQPMYKPLIGSQPALINLVFPADHHHHRPHPQQHHHRHHPYYHPPLSCLCCHSHDRPSMTTRDWNWWSLMCCHKQAIITNDQWPGRAPADQDAQITKFNITILSTDQLCNLFASLYVLRL